LGITSSSTSANSSSSSSSTGNRAFSDDANTILLVHCDGADESTTFTDVSTGGVDSPHGLTAAGSAQVDTAQKKYGTGSLLITAADSNIYADDSDDWNIPTDATLECFVRFSSGALAGTQTSVFFNHYVNSGNFWAFRYVHGTGLQFRERYLSVTTIDAVLAWTPTEGVWYHVVLLKDDTNYTIGFKAGRFVPGENIGTLTGTDTSEIRDFSGDLLLGSTDHAEDVWFDEFRISNTLRYTYTIP